MNSPDSTHLPAGLRPYLFIALAGILAFAPVSFMAFALKNDIVAIEYPINYYMSQCIHNGEIPYWFNSWGLGFPLQSNLTWGIYSTPQLLFNSIFNYNLYILHIEFIFFLVMSGWTMFYLLRRHFLKDTRLAFVLSICYMLSGFMVGSSQWLLYITAAAFIPLVVHAYLQLLKSPSYRNAFLFGICYFLMFTSVYVAFSIITTYGLVVFFIVYLLSTNKAKPVNRKIIRFAIIGALIAGLLCLPCLYYTAELLPYMERGKAIASQKMFFNSNYLHPASLESLLFPFSSVKMNFANTEGTMLDSYIGLFTLLFLPAAVLQTLKERNRSSMLLLFGVLFFLLISFGEMTPLRNALNFLPGFSYFRNPGLFRLYFILLLVFYLGNFFRDRSWEQVFQIKTGPYSTILRYTFAILAGICLVTFCVTSHSLTHLNSHSISERLKDLDFNQAVCISSLLQFLFIIALFLLARKSKFRLASILLVSDLIINTLLCTPFFTVSSHSMREASLIMHSQKGFPVQDKQLNEAAAIFIDSKQNTWDNVNVYQKLISSNDTYRGPLTLKQFSDSLIAAHAFDKPLAFIREDSVSKVDMTMQLPSHVRMNIDLSIARNLTLLQNYFPGWKAYYNKERVAISSAGAGMTIAASAGKGTIDFIYEKKGLWISALLLHLLVLIFFIWKIITSFRGRSGSALQ